MATYNIPETITKETPTPEKWLWILLGQDISPAEEALLQNIVKALKADYQTNTHIVISQQLIALREIPRGNPRLILSFGVQPSAIGYWIDMPAPGIRFLEKTIFILSPELKKLNESPVAKKQLWSLMQKIPDLQAPK